MLGITVESASGSESKKTTYYLQIATSTQEDYEQVVDKLGIEDWDYSSLYD
ncbi:hypothetical protein GXP67_28565 [Rhodocytophaga rosea]|uniref:Uncharacterized protein n=1 Tax=Rhodocytophaga rosea TaxID=2704465 RepID=A0A6C0GQH2_9BACT|nr:hypothetical protein [Rhodocytophaga rosea]QHT70325.1 hypothetical protein GXP67_28565 [Rhodocytophaga rosea]